MEDKDYHHLTCGSRPSYQKCLWYRRGTCSSGVGLPSLLLTSLVYGQGLFRSSQLRVYGAESSSISKFLCVAYCKGCLYCCLYEVREVVNIAIHEAGDVVKRWNLRYFMLLVGHQPTLVYYRKVSGRPVLLQVFKGCKGRPAVQEDVSPTLKPLFAAGGRGSSKCTTHGGSQSAGEQAGCSLTGTALDLYAVPLSADLMSLTSDFLQISGTAKGGSLFQFTVQASGETYELAATTQQERRRSAAASQRLPQLSLPALGALLAPEK